MPFLMPLYRDVARSAIGYNSKMAMKFERQLWISSSIIVGSFVVISIALYFLAGDISATANKISTDRGLIDKETGTLAALADLKQQVSQAAVYQAAMNGLLPTQDGLIGFGNWLSNAAAANGVSVNFSFGNNTVSPSATSFGAVNFSFTATGSASALDAFLTDIEEKDPGFFVTVNSFDMVNTNGSYQLTGQGTTFFRQ
jgi:hypothetical protein